MFECIENSRRIFGKRKEAVLMDALHVLHLRSLIPLVLLRNMTGNQQLCRSVTGN